MQGKGPHVDLESIKEGWNQGAIKDAITYLLGSKHKRNLDLNSFFALKSRQAERWTSAFFHEMNFAPAGKRMLDIGCGIGGMVRYFSDLFAEAHGVDISDEMITRAHDLNRDKTNLSFSTSNGFDLSMYQDSSFDFCFSFATFQYFPSLVVVKNSFREVARILKPNGLFRIQLDGRKWVMSRIPVPFYRPVYNILRNNYLFKFYGRLITDNITVKAYRGVVISWRAVFNIMQELPFHDIRITGKDTSYMWVSGRKH